MAQAQDRSAAAPTSNASAPSQASGELLPVGGGYRLLKLLGRGAFGEVWRAEAPGGVSVAIKIVTRSVTGAEAQRELDALQLMKRLRHQNLVVLQAFFSLPDRLIIVLEMADGSLRRRFQQCQEAGLPGIPAPELLRYFREAADALDYLHAEQVQHRDIKPDNILLLGSHIKVADFGLAKLLEKSSLQTASHAGTPIYMAPEVWNSKLSVHSDQYSLAIMYAELRTGRFPFAYDSLPSLMKAHLMDAPDLTALGPHEQPVLLRALAKDPSQRYPSCTSFVKALVEALMAEVAASTEPRHTAKRSAEPSSKETQRPDPAANGSTASCGAKHQGDPACAPAGNGRAAGRGAAGAAGSLQRRLPQTLTSRPRNQRRPRPRARTPKASRRTQSHRSQSRRSQTRHPRPTSREAPNRPRRRRSPWPSTRRTSSGHCAGSRNWSSRRSTYGRVTRPTPLQSSRPRRTWSGGLT
jgi:serine/threonine protein kinase